MAVSGSRRRAEPPPAATPFVKERRRVYVSAATRESFAIFALAFVGYTVVGYRLVVQQHVVVFDAVARLAHAYFVWYNDPPKLAAVGFVWPPVSTLVLLPAATIRSLGTSLAALPLTTAFFAGALLATLNAVFRLCELPQWLRYALVALFALNPMIVFYSTNGMSEVVYLFLLVYGLYMFLRWFLTREARFLILASLALAVGIVTRYEVVTWAAAIVGVVVVTMIRQHVSRDELEGTLIAYLVPIAYCLGLWLFVNWALLKDPFFWLHYQAPGAAAPAAPQTAPVQAPRDVLGLTEAFARLLSLNSRLFPPTLLVLCALVLVFVFRRDLMALTLSIFIGLNAVFTGLLIAVSGNSGFLQLRYNMRAMPLALIGIAWLHLILRGQARGRLALGAVSVALLAVSLPVTWNTMRTWPYQFEEQAFTRALSAGTSQEGTHSIGGYAVGIQPEQQMADYIRTHVRRKNTILTDDAQSFAVMLLSGRPDLFLDRIDHGDAYWLDVRDRPWGHVHFVLVSRAALNDIVLVRYPGLTRDEEPGMTTVFRSSRWLLARVARRDPQLE